MPPINLCDPCLVHVDVTGKCDHDLLRQSGGGGAGGYFGAYTKKWRRGETNA